MIKLLIVDDSEETRELLKMVLSKNTNLDISEAYSLATAIEEIKRTIPDIILLDLSLPDGNGSEICSKIRTCPNIYGNPFILALTADTSQESVNKNLRLGCDDYIKKPFDFTELSIRIEKFIERVPIVKDYISYENIKLFPNNKTVQYNDVFVTLSKNEFEILQYFILNRGLLLSRTNILDNVWSDNFDISDKAVDQCLKRLRKKLPILNDFLVSKRGFGYILK
ncbi:MULTISPECIES: response regulator transcription factor [unclassified Fusobacterium]|uniref:response regulator transcription factor n=1 Tax=unclassified Fusobacterium TaxID=2648384 RepID=UPI0025C15596|nr:response regulator transcription factor [Fusobacterium sp.]